MLPGHLQPSHPAKPLVRLSAVCKRFGKLEVLKGIDLDVSDGGTIAIIGPSGSGKSTLVRCLNHLEPIQGGAIEIDGFLITPRGVEKDGRLLPQREVARFRTLLGNGFSAIQSISAPDRLRQHRRGAYGGSWP
jgi:polar amino acid transport system ATP-binding protein